MVNLFRRQRNTMFMNEKNEANIGDTVSIMETRPLSRTKDGD